MKKETKSVENKIDIDKNVIKKDDATFSKKARKKTKSFLSDFKKFAFKGNIVDLAIAVVIGAAFGAIVTSLVNDIIMPWISVLIGDVSFSDLKIILKHADTIKGTSEIAFRYGMFLQKIFEFLIIAFSIFIVIKILSAARDKFDNDKKEEEKKSISVAQNKTEVLLTEIRDLLKKEKIDSSTKINRRKAHDKN